MNGDTRPLSAEALIAEQLRATGRRYGMRPGTDAIDWFPEAEAWAARIASHLANHGYGFLDAERARRKDAEEANAIMREAAVERRARYAALEKAAREAVKATTAYVIRDAAIRKALADLRAALDGEPR